MIISAKFINKFLLFIVLVQFSNSHFIDDDDSWMPRLTKKDLLEYSLVSRIQSTNLYKFTFYRDVSILYYYIPDDVQEAKFTFTAHEKRISTMGACEPQDIDIHIKSGGFPVVSPQNISFPEDFVDNSLRNEIYSLKMQSDDETTNFTLFSPTPGEWFALAFVSWTDPKSDKIEQQGIATVCDTVLYTDLRVKKLNVTIISGVDIKFPLRNTSSTITDMYKLFISYEVSQYSLNFTLLPFCDSCTWMNVMIQAKSLPLEDNYLMNCMIQLNESSTSYVLEFDSFPKEWHYIQVSYGVENNIPIIPKCKKIEKISNELSLYSSPDVIQENVYELVRDSKSEYFTFEYNLPPHSNESVPAIAVLTSGNITTFKFRVFPVQDIGGTLSIGISLKLSWKYYTGYVRKKHNNATEYHFSKEDPFQEVVVCASQFRKQIPLINGSCESNGKIYPATVVVNTTDSASVSNIIHIPYPEIGIWYLTLAVFCDAQSVCPCPVHTVKKNETKYVVKTDGALQGPVEPGWYLGSTNCNASVVFSISSAPCINKLCKNGNCNYYMSGGFIYSTCSCRKGYAGWDCSDASNVSSAGEILMSTLFLTLSNLLFIPSIYFAIRRQYYTEATVYFFTMFFSTFYHACDVSDANYSLCIVRLGVLQYCDFFCGLLSFWVTLVAMAALDNKMISILHMFGAILIAFGTELNKQALLVFLIPVVIGVCIVVIAWGIRCHRTKKLFPARAYLIMYAPIGLLLVAIGLICFAFLQTNSNYHIVHSIWHMVIALSILCFLPNRAIFFPKS